VSVGQGWHFFAEYLFILKKKANPKDSFFHTFKKIKIKSQEI